MNPPIPSHPLAAAFPGAGLPWTICVIAYGPNTALATRFLGSLYGTVDPSLFELRVGLNEAAPETERVFEEYSRRYRNILVWSEPVNIFKNPLMRRMFWERPLANAWTIWCDDDTHFTRKDWLQRLILKMSAAPAVALWGKPFWIRIADPAAPDWIERAPWFRGRDLCHEPDAAGRPACKFDFITGGFWACKTAVLNELQWPDRRLVHALEDVMLSEALRQNGYLIGQFEYGVQVNDAVRRNADATEVDTSGLKLFSAK